MSCKQRCIQYNDGTPSREVEEDWEASGQEEMNEIYQRIKDKERDKTSIVTNVRDRLDNLNDLIEVCNESLLYSDMDEIKKHVAHVLYFHVKEQIHIAEEELRKV